MNKKTKIQLVSDNRSNQVRNTVNHPLIVIVIVIQIKKQSYMEVVIFSVFSLHKLTSWGEKNKVWIFGKHLVFWTVCNKMNFCLRLSCFTLAHYCFSLCNHCFVMQPDRLASLWSQNLCLVSLVLFGPNVLLLLVIFFFSLSSVTVSMSCWATSPCWLTARSHSFHRWVGKRRGDLQNIISHIMFW